MTVSLFILLLNWSVAGTCMPVEISSAHANSSMSTDTVVIEPSSFHAPANYRGSSAQQKKDTQQRSIRPQGGSGNASRHSASRFDLQPAAWQDCVSTAFV